MRQSGITHNSLYDVIWNLFGTERRITKRRYVSGGDINEVCVLVLDDGRRLFLKSNSIRAFDNFSAEAEGLAAMRETGTVQVPELLGIGKDPEGFSFLLMEYIEAERASGKYWEELGRNLACMHKAPVTGKASFGWKRDNYIGARRQINAGHDSWISFFRDCRLAPQFGDADRYFDTTDRKRAEHLLSHLDRFLIEPERPSLVHGDLWSGNVIAGKGGKAWLIDPAVYYGHPEADLAMTELFGGFAGAFYAAYQEENPLEAGYKDRRDLYNLYQLLNHLNMFGASYLSSVQQILKRYAG